MNEPYLRLPGPLDLGITRRSNRVLMGSTHSGPEDGRRQFPAMAARFAERARDGVERQIGAFVRFAKLVQSPLPVGAGRLLCVKTAAHRQRLMTSVRPLPGDLPPSGPP